MLSYLVWWETKELSYFSFTFMVWIPTGSLEEEVKDAIVRFEVPDANMPEYLYVSKDHHQLKSSVTVRWELGKGKDNIVPIALNSKENKNSLRVSWERRARRNTSNENQSFRRKGCYLKKPRKKLILKLSKYPAGEVICFWAKPSLSRDVCRAW